MVSAGQLYRLSRNPSILLALAITVLFLYSSLRQPDPTSSAFQFPSLFPSIYPPIRAYDPHLTALSRELRHNLSSLCRAEPVYTHPYLTRSQEKRYAHLRRPRLPGRKNGEGRYILVTTIRQIKSQLPDLLNAILILTTFLGADRLIFSILEGPSDDCTSEALETVLLPLLSSLGVPRSRVHLRTREPQIDFSSQNRIQVLAELRNRALAPLWEEGGANDVLAVVAFNDVYLRASDALELLHQHVRAWEVSGKETGITTGMDYLEKEPEWYYDVWVGRTIDTGDLFYPIDQSWWSPSSDLFHTSPSSLSHYQFLTPFQVYSSWNGLAVLSPTPFLPPHDVRFRRSDAGRGECAASECLLIAQDFWDVGMGRAQIVPSVQLGYTERVAEQIQDDLLKRQTRLGWMDGIPRKKLDTTVLWIDDPPEKVRCHPWPEVHGLSANVWETTIWVDPFTGIG